MKRFVISILLISLLIPMTACNDDDECPTCPDPTPEPAPEPTMANIWPHEDGTAWTYDGIYREFEEPEPEKRVESTIPTMEELHAALGTPISWDETLFHDGLYRIAFDGMITTESGAEGQDLVETMFADMSDYTKDNSAHPDPILALIAQMRPDLRSAIAEHLGMGEKELVDVPRAPYFLGSYCFSAEDDGYFGYGDLNQSHSWVMLEGDLSVGSEFSLQLIPMLAEDIWLYGKIWSVGPKTVNGKDFENVVEAMYLVDLGETTAVDENGSVVGTYHPYMYGHTFFVPELGPVACVERHYFGSSNALQVGTGFGMLEYVMDFVGVTYAE